MAFLCCVEDQPGRDMTVQVFEAWLQQCDIDRDGDLSSENLKEALHSLKIWFAWWKSGQAMKEVDPNHNGKIDKPKEIEKLINYAQQHMHTKLHQTLW